MTILIVLKAVYPNMAYYQTSKDAYCSSCSSSIALSSSWMTPSAIEAANCVISLYHLQVYSNNYTTKQTVATLNDNVINFETVQLYWAVFSIHCFMGCT